MSKLSRRNVVGGATASLALVGVAVAERRSHPLFESKLDPVVAEVEAWRSAYAVRETMIREWQGLENALYDKVRPLKMNLSQAGRANFPESRAMRVLDRKIKNASRKLDRAAERIVLMAPTRAAGAAAKIELGLIVQGPYDWEEYAYALVQGGLQQLRELAGIL